MTSMHDEIQKLIDKFDNKVATDESFKKSVEPLKKTVNIDLQTEAYSFRLDDAKIVWFRDELSDPADIKIISTPESLTAMIHGELRPMKAYFSKKIQIEGNIQDLMFLTKMF